MRRNPPIRERLATSCALAGLAALAAAGPLALCVPTAHAQVAGPEIFAKEPQTPLELWDAADYLIRTGQVKQAVPYLNKFLKSNPDDATLLQIRDQFGNGAVLRLQDYPETRDLARPLLLRMAEASRRNATRPERIERFIAALTKSKEEQDYAVERLREAGPYAVPPLVRALSRPALSAADRDLIVRNMGRLDRSTVPPLLATLDSPDARLVAAAAHVLGRLGDPRVLPQLMDLAAQPDASSPVRDEARRAVEVLAGRPFASLPRSAVRVLTDAARKFHLHAFHFPGDPVLIWVWDDDAKEPVARQVARTDAEAYFGLKLAREAVALDPADVEAQVVLVSIALEKAVERVGFAAFPGGDPSGTFAAALAAGPDVLGRVVRSALADGKPDLAAVAVTALGQVTDGSLPPSGRRVNPLIEALASPSRRVEFAAARALVLLNPHRPFAGSSWVVPTLARFVTSQGPPRAVVIDANTSRGGQTAGFLAALGYDPMLATTGDQGFRLASETADVELIFVDPHLTQGPWQLTDTLGNLRADARTAGIPTYVVAPLLLHTDLHGLAERFPGVRLLVTPLTATLLEQQLGGRPVKLPEEERAAYAREAASLLAQVAAEPGSPYQGDLARVEPALATALNLPATGPAASAALADVPDVNAQRSLADAALDPSRATPLRLAAAAQLARSIQRFGPLATADQEARLLPAFDRETDPALRAALAAVIGALRPRPAQSGRRLEQAIQPEVPPPAQEAEAPAPKPAEAVEPAPTPAPAPAPAPVPEPAPKPAQPAPKPAQPVPKPAQPAPAAPPAEAAPTPEKP